MSAFAADPLSGLLRRTLPHNGDAQKFSWTIISTPEDQDFFTVSSDGRKVHIKANNFISAATGINWYLQHKAGVNITWNNPTDRLPTQLPVCAEERHVASVDIRYYLNFCTHSYSMAFWDWKRWQQEIDWMALHGVNLPLIITGMESVWKRVLEEHYGYHNAHQFLTGPAYFGWFFMNNMTGWGGPLPERWFKDRTLLARRIFARLNDYGMTPIVPGYVGMIPCDFLTAATRNVEHWTTHDIVRGGYWNSFERPAFVRNETRLKEFAQHYYAAIERTFGDVLSTHYYAIDPFHEGVVPQGVAQPARAITAMWDALRQYDREAVWVAQHWQHNPTTDLTHSVPQGRLLILNLHGDSHGESVLSGANADAQGRPHKWVWGMTSNFGGNIGLFGRMRRMMESFYAALDQADRQHLAGIGALPEGIEQNPMLYDLLYALPWRTPQYTTETWLHDYIAMRYGVSPANDPATFQALLRVWHTLAEGVYNCSSNNQQGCTESVFMMRPALRPGTVSTWASSSWFWNIDSLRSAVGEFLALSPTLGQKINYRYDLIDFMRQVLADHGKRTLDSLTTITPDGRPALEERFLNLILDQDRLLATLPDFRIGTWTERARMLGHSTAECNLYEQNARMLLTTWGHRDQCDRGGLHDYANREWAGLLSAYYYPRWKAFFNAGGRPLPWFDQFEWAFATGTLSSSVQPHLPPHTPYAFGTFTSRPEGDPLTVAQSLYCKYFRR